MKLFKIDHHRDEKSVPMAAQKASVPRGPKREKRWLIYDGDVQVGHDQDALGQSLECAQKKRPQQGELRPFLLTPAAGEGGHGAINARSERAGNSEQRLNNSGEPLRPVLDIPVGGSTEGLCHGDRTIYAFQKRQALGNGQDRQAG